MSDKEKINKIEEAFRVKKPKVLNSKRSAFLSDCSSPCVVLSIGRGPRTADDLFITDLSTGFETSYSHPQIRNGELAKFGNKFWIFRHGVFELREFELNNNCTATYIRTINVDPSMYAASGSGVYTVNGLAAKDANTLIMGSLDSSPASSGTLMEVDISGSTAVFTPLFQTGHINGDLVYIPSSNTIATTEFVGIGSSGVVARHYDYNGTILGQSSVGGGSVGYGMFCHEGKVIINTDSVTKWFDLDTYTTPSYSLNIPNAGDQANSSSCCDPSYLQPTGECYDIGDTGPEGGIIFAVPLGHPQNNGVNQTNFYYEVAKNDIATGGTPSSGYVQTCGTPGVGGWAVAGAEWGVHNKSNITTSTDFGTGHKNTDAIHAYPLSPGNPTGGIHPWLDTHDIAATLCKQYPSANDDWFLPSLDEFTEMVDASITYGFTLGLNYDQQNPGPNMEGTYWTSSQWRNDPANGLVIANPDLYSWAYNSANQFQPAQPSLSYRCHALSVRPIRRFECEPDPCTYTTDCSCIEYNYRDFVWAVHYGTFNNSPVHCQLVGSLGSMSGPSFTNTPATQWDYVVNGLDSVIGDNVIGLSIAAKDVMGNEFTLTDWQDDSIGYTITIWDRWYNYLGKWKYDNFIYGTPPEGLSTLYPNISHPELPDRLYFFLSDVTHLDGPSSIVDYNISPNGNNLLSATGAFFKIEAACNTNLPTAFENGCNHIEPYSSSQLGIANVPRVCLWENAPPNFPIGIVNDCLQSYGTYSPPTYYLSYSSCYQSTCVPCTYQVGDTGPGGGIIVAVPYMNVNSPTDGCVGPIVPALQGMPLKNPTDYYYEISPENLNQGGDYMAFGNVNINLDNISSYTTPDTSVIYCPPINPSSNINNEYMGQGEQATQDIVTSSSGGQPVASFPITGFVHSQPISAFIACDNYQSNGYTDWFLPTTQEMEFARNYTPPGTLSSTHPNWTQNNPLPDNLYWTCNAQTNNTPVGTLNRITEYPQGIGTEQAFAVSGEPFSGNSGPNGYGWRWKTIRSYPFNVRAMRKFKCSNNSSTPNNRRARFVEKRTITKDVGPFGVSGYYPLYGTIDGAVNASPESSYHIHQFGDVEYYMPNGLEMGVTQFHGDWEPDNISINARIITSPDDFVSGQTDEVTQPEEQVVQLEQQLPDEPEEIPLPPTPTYTPPPSNTSSSESEEEGY